MGSPIEAHVCVVDLFFTELKKIGIINIQYMNNEVTVYVDWVSLFTYFPLCHTMKKFSQVTATYRYINKHNEGNEWSNIFTHKQPHFLLGDFLRFLIQEGE